MSFFRVVGKGKTMTIGELLDRHHGFVGPQSGHHRAAYTETWRRRALGVKRRWPIQARSEMVLIRSLMRDQGTEQSCRGEPREEDRA